MPGGTDLTHVDTHGIAPEEYDELPELNDAWFADAEFRVGDRFVRVGPPGTPQGPVTITLPPEVVDHFRRGGPGWQARIDAALLDVVRRERADEAGG